MMDFLEKIQKSFPNLSKNQKKVAEYLGRDGAMASFDSVSQLARKVGVSDSSVVRLAQALGYQGYPELRRELQEAFKKKVGGAGRLQKAVSELPTRGIVESLFRNDVESIEKTLSQFDDEDFSKAIDLLWRARRIFVIGFRSAFSLAYFLNFRLVRMGLDVHLILVTGGTSLLEQLALIDRRDVLVAIGFDRIPEETTTALDHAIACKARILGISHSSTSEIARKSTLSLLAWRQDDRTQSLVSHMALLNALAIGMANRKRTRSLKALERLDRMAETYRKNL
jgi:DNA-binding MurR/RpiR family transcriptional regulator